MSASPVEAALAALTSEVAALTREVREGQRTARRDHEDLDARVLALELARAREQGREEARLRIEREAAEREVNEERRAVLALAPLWVKLGGAALTLIATFLGGSQVHL